MRKPQSIKPFKTTAVRVAHRTKSCRLRCLKLITEMESLYQGGVVFLSKRWDPSRWSPCSPAHFSDRHTVPGKPPAPPCLLRHVSTTRLETWKNESDFGTPAACVWEVPKGLFLFHRFSFMTLSCLLSQVCRNLRARHKSKNLVLFASWFRLFEI